MTGSENLSGIIPLKKLYDFVKEHRRNHEAVRIEKTALGKEYCGICDKITEDVDENGGFNLWGCYDEEGDWTNIYLGMAATEKTRKISGSVSERNLGMSDLAFGGTFTQRQNC